MHLSTGYKAIIDSGSCRYEGTGGQARGDLHLRLALFFLMMLYKTRPAPAKNIATSGPNLPGVTSPTINPNAALLLLYPVFPWGMFGVGKPRLDTVLNTFRYDNEVVKFKGYIGWKQDDIRAVGLGLKDKAWRLTELKLQNSGRRFPAFWGSGFDWLTGNVVANRWEKILLFPKDIDPSF